MFYWIDSAAHVAYIAVRGAVPHFPEILSLHDRLFADPRWSSDMPIVEDVREITVHPPASTIVAEWRAYVQERRPLLSGLRWAIVAPDSDPGLRAVLAAAAIDAASNHVTMQVFSSMIEAHVWLARRGPSWLM